MVLRFTVLLAFTVCNVVDGYTSDCEYIIIDSNKMLLVILSVWGGGYQGYEMEICILWSEAVS